MPRIKNRSALCKKTKLCYWVEGTIGFIFANQQQTMILHPEEDNCFMIDHFASSMNLESQVFTFVTTSRFKSLRTEQCF